MNTSLFDWQNLATWIATLAAATYIGWLVFKKVKSFLPSPVGEQRATNPSKKTTAEDCHGCGTCAPGRVKAPGRGV